VLARSVASLDLLSGGRVELGLGAGAFWDAIEAMGGRRLEPGQAVDALAEAIEIIRQLWDTEARGGIRFHGAYYRVSGAKRGPAPAHPVGIWVGAYQPRMLRLTGRLADGWLPSLSYLRPGQLTEGNAIIDQAAAEAGRAPGAVRRLLNVSGEFAASPPGSSRGPGGPGPAGTLSGPSGYWAEQLTELALTEGISTFILASDEPDAVRAFAAEVAPAVRELVGAARGRSADQGAASTATPVGNRRDAGMASGRPRGEEPARAEDEPGVEPTPDDGTRLSGQRLWDEGARPRRPAPPPEARYTRAGRAASAELVQVHDMLRGELTAIRDLIADVQKGAVNAAHARSQLNQMTMRQNNWTMGAYCQSYCRLVTAHHSGEDAALFPYLRAREAGLGPVLDRLQEEHVIIHDVLDSVDRALVDFIEQADDTAGDFTELQQAADLLTDALLSHLAYEERELTDPLARYGFYSYGDEA
jgi:hemerythrin-like domain-containing protein